MENQSIYRIDCFYCNKKIAKNWQEPLHRLNNNIVCVNIS